MEAECSNAFNRLRLYFQVKYDSFELDTSLCSFVGFVAVLVVMVVVLVGEGGDKYLTLHYHDQNDSAFRWAAV